APRLGPLDAPRHLRPVLPRRAGRASLQREHEGEANGEQQYEEADGPQDSCELPSMGRGRRRVRPLAFGVDGPHFSTSPPAACPPYGSGTTAFGRLVEVRRKVFTSSARPAPGRAAASAWTSPSRRDPRR